MKACEYPMKSNLFKNFDRTDIVKYDDLTAEEREYEVVDICIRGLNPLGCYKVVIIASTETMKLFNLKPLEFKTGNGRRR